MARTHQPRNLLRWAFSSKKRSVAGPPCPLCHLTFEGGGGEGEASKTAQKNPQCDATPLGDIVRWWMTVDSGTQIRLYKDAEPYLATNCLGTDRLAAWVPAGASLGRRRTLLTLQNRSLYLVRLEVVCLRIFPVRPARELIDNARVTLHGPANLLEHPVLVV